eukprot:jgi/Ulvmu1/3627/UM017_0039.1
MLHAVVEHSRRQARTCIKPMIQGRMPCSSRFRTASVLPYHQIKRVTAGWHVQERGRPDLAAFLSLFEHKVREHSKLNRQEVHAITAFLVGRVKEFALFEGAQSQLRQLLVQSTVLDEDDSSSDDAASDDWSVESGELINRIRGEAAGGRMGSHLVLYKRGVASDTFTLVLQGRVLVWAGQEEFPSELGPWQSVGTKALFSESYHPDFAACTTGPCRLIQISRAAFQKAASTVAKVQQSRDDRLSGSFRRAPSIRLPDAPAPAANGAVSVSFGRGVLATAQATSAATPLSDEEGPHTVSADAATGRSNTNGNAAVALPGSVLSGGSTEEQNAVCGQNGSTRTTGTNGSGKAAGETASASNSGVLRGVVVLGDAGEPVFIDEEGGGTGAAEGGQQGFSDGGLRTSRGPRHSSVEMMELEVVKSKEGEAAALFRAVTPAESARRKQPGWWDGEEGRRTTLPHSPQSGSMEYDRV